MKTQKTTFMKNLTKPFLALFIIASTFTACKKDDVATDPPAINNFKIGTNNNKIAYPGTDIHMEGQITAADNIANVKLNIKPKTGTGWNFTQEYTDGFAGLKNAEFHKHVDVPADAVLGIYVVTLTVTDANGRIATFNADIEIKVDATIPTATGFEVGLNAAKNDLHVEAAISAPNKIAKIVIEIHGSGWEKEVEYTDAAMVGQTNYNLHKHIDVTAAPAGHYHVHLKIVDQAGKENEIEEHFDK